MADLRASLVAPIASLFARRGTSSPGPPGTSLIPRPQRSPILEPNVRSFLETLFERGGLEHPGLFRNPVDNATVFELVRPLLTGSLLMAAAHHSVDLLAKGLLFYLTESRQPLIPVHVHKDMLFDFCNATTDEDKSLSLRKAVCALDPVTTTIISHLSSFLSLVASRSSVNQMNVSELTNVFAPVFFPPPAKPNPRLIANRNAITLHLISFHMAILPASSSPLSFFFSASPSTEVLVVSPRANVGGALVLTKLTPSEVVEASSSSSSSSTPGGVPSASPASLLAVPSHSFGGTSPRWSASPRGAAAAAAAAAAADENSQPNSEDDSSYSSSAPSQRVQSYGDFKTAELTVTGTTSPSQDPSLVARESILKLARTDPDALWDTASRGHIPSDDVISTLVGADLSASEKNNLIQPLLRELILSECLASNGTATKRGCTHLYHSLCKWVDRRISAGGGSAETFLGELDTFLHRCFHPGDTCFVLSAFQASAETQKISMGLDAVYSLLESHLLLLGESKQQAKLAFLPWLDAEKLLMAVAGVSHAEGKQAINRLKASYRALKRAAR